MDKYVFSGSLTNEMHDILKAHPKFKPLDILTTQIDRAGVRQAIEYKKEGFCRWFFLDSGAFSVHTGKAHTTLDEYIDYVNSIDEYIDVCAQLDTIPGKFGKEKSPEDYVYSANKSWEDFLYMREHVKSPEKVMPIWHYKESFEALDRILNWKDESGKLLDYIGISPANDVSQSNKNVYLKEVYDHIKKSKNPNVKTHLYGMTSLDALSKFPCYSADSVSHRLISGYNKILTKNFGVISLSDRARTSKTKSNMSFLQTADDYNLSILKKEVEDMGFTVEKLKESSSARVCFTMLTIQELVATRYAHKETNLVRSRKLF